jgi:hypothetical protein
MTPIPTGGIREANPLGCARLAGSEGVDDLASAKRDGPTRLTWESRPTSRSLCLWP